MRTAWLFILIGGLFEPVWATFMKMSDGFSDPLYSALTLVFLFVSVYLLYKGFEMGAPIGVGYAVWVGIGSVISVVLGIVLFDEPTAPLRLLMIGVVLGGIIGLQLTEPKKGDQEHDTACEDP